MTFIRLKFPDEFPLSKTLSDETLFGLTKSFCLEIVFYYYYFFFFWHWSVISNFTETCGTFVLWGSIPPLVFRSLASSKEIFLEYILAFAYVELRFSWSSFTFSFLGINLFFYLQLTYLYCNFFLSLALFNDLIFISRPYLPKIIWNRNCLAIQIYQIIGNSSLICYLILTPLIS